MKVSKFCNLAPCKANNAPKYFSSLLIKKPSVVVAGSGWAGYRLAMDIDKSKFDVHIVSPRNHFLFTPLLPSTAVGTLEFRAIQEPVRTIPGIHYYQASIDSISFSAQTVTCTDYYHMGNSFTVNYDALVLATGCETNTFGIEGVENNPNVFYLKQLEQSRAIRNRLIECFERASSPGCPDSEIDALLTFVIVGGGPTSTEFSAELYDFCTTDVARWYPDLFDRISIVIVEATGHLLGSFNESIVGYVEKLFKKRNINVLTDTAVKSVQMNKAFLSNGETLTFGAMIWSAGIKQVDLIRNIDSSLAKSKNGRLLIDNDLHALSKEESSDKEAVPKPVFNGTVFALGDCACNHVKPLPALAQVASQQAIHLSKMLNKFGIEGIAQGRADKFKYHHLGAMASVGEWKGVYDSTNIGPENSEISGYPIKGFAAFLLWRAAYWTKQVSINNKILILMYWFKSTVFGRDISRF